MPSLTPVRMPKWGLSMQEGKIVDWWKPEGSTLKAGEDLVDIETAKISNVFEAPVDGVLKKIVAQPGETLPVGALIAVLADEGASDADVDAFVAEFQASFVPEDAEAAGDGLKLSILSVGGRTIRIGQAGPEDGDPVVLIHGYSGDLNGWAFNIPALAEKAPVVAVDLPGHGGSGKDVGEPSLQSFADTVAALLGDLGVTRAHLVGHSLGGAVAARVAADHPGLVASLSLIAPAYMPGGRLNEGFLTDVAEGMRAKDLKPALELLVADPDLITRDMVEDMVKYKRLDGVEEALAALRDRMVDGADARALQADLAKIPKALVIASHNDQIVGAPDEAALPPGWRVVWMDEAGHLPHLEKAAEVDRQLVEQIG